MSLPVVSASAKAAVKDTGNGAVDLDEVKHEWPTDVTFLPADLDGSHAFRCELIRDGRGGAMCEIFPSAVHPGFLFVHTVEFASPDPNWAMEQWFTRRPIRWTDDEFGREFIGFNIPPHLRDEVKQAGWRKLNGWDYRSMLAQLGAGHVNESVEIPA